ncbi:MAG: hypothetical protein AVDCRST_MAG19-227 [uncultured Thermomicrobiales bacterium]|uniref:Uncharacterized protein n=1 Tax=uncultured Thermomicrobiales bacterium TaxID=1645740 RepID=A0A6J4UCS9_9BACT|nr:MAG: hypothetical protein AVDCRST_MAG19-227 [uncultured Thermomicrobiales bacterium]
MGRTCHRFPFRQGEGWGAEPGRSGLVALRSKPQTTETKLAAGSEEGCARQAPIPGGREQSRPPFSHCGALVPGSSKSSRRCLISKRSTVPRR